MGKIEILHRYPRFQDFIFVIYFLLFVYLLNTRLLLFNINMILRFFFFTPGISFNDVNKLDFLSEK